ncbi:hypothetical protein [Pedobacter gandavensis]|uniref:hypothetical protein n=1 Tax=Pedobacter gandavensis TaxID=2679963 RepID=UPI00292DB454|nr:hypothetical protein [Pedobacter gandavensis]
MELWSVRKGSIVQPVVQMAIAGPVRAAITVSIAMQEDLVVCVLKGLKVAFLKREVLKVIQE